MQKELFARQNSFKILSVSDRFLKMKIAIRIRTMLQYLHEASKL